MSGSNITGRAFVYNRPEEGSNSTNKGNDARAVAVSGQRNELIIRRTDEEIARQPDKINLDAKALEVCPTIQGERSTLRLLNLKNNRIRTIGVFGDLQALIFLDLYGNRLTSLEGE
jgi:Leucine-rich repeat (LRR) protein